MNKTLFVKPPDRFLEDEFVYQQLGPHYLQSYLSSHGFPSDLLILYQKPTHNESSVEPSFTDLYMVAVLSNGGMFEGRFDIQFFYGYDIVGFSVMTPQAPDAYLLNIALKSKYRQITTVIGGSHPRYYQTQVESLPDSSAFDFIVPQDEWRPML